MDIKQRERKTTLHSDNCKRKWTDTSLVWKRVHSLTVHAMETITIIIAQLEI